MNIEKKLCLFVASFMLVLFLLNIASVAVFAPGDDSSLSPTPKGDVFLSQDIEPLETTIELDGTPGLRGWYISDVTVSFSVISMAPDYTTYYSYDETNWLMYIDSFVITNEGYTPIFFYSIDSFGFKETTKSSIIQIDKTAPSLTLETESVPGVGLNVSLIAIETESYLVDVAYRLDNVRWERYFEPITLKEERTYKIEYRAQDAAGHLMSKVDYIDVVIEPVKSPTEVQYIGATSGFYSDLVFLEAQIIDLLTELPIADRVITFLLGAQTATAVTDLEGHAYSSLILDQPADIYTLTVSFDGDNEYLASSDTTEFVLMKEDAVIFYTGLTIIDKRNPTITLMATVFEDDDGNWGDLTRISVTFTIYLSTDQTTHVQVIGPIMVELTDIAGMGVAIIETPNLPEGDYMVIVSLSPEINLYYSAPDSEVATITIYEPKRGKTMGAGWVRDSEGNKGHFVFLVKYSNRGTLKGFAHYTVRIDNLVYFVRTTEITGFSIDGKHAFFEAKCVIYVYNLETCEKTILEDTYRLRIDVWDYKKRCRNDIFQIQIIDKYGLVVYEAGYDPLGYVHRGNITIHIYLWKHKSHHCHKHW